MSAMAWECIVAAARELGHPTEGEFAQNLWILCSGEWTLNPQQATRLYQECGYVPFAGYPLKQAVALAA